MDFKITEEQELMVQAIEEAMNPREPRAVFSGVRQERYPSAEVVGPQKDLGHVQHVPAC